MKGQQLLGALLLAVGLLGLAYGGFSYTKESHDVNVGPIHMSVDEKERVNVPIWAGVAAAVGGAAMLAMGRRTA
jgi:drug/metabolite transporter (DMT)-like permease